MSFNSLKNLQKEIDIISDDYNSLLNPFYNDKNNKNIKNEKDRIINRLLDLKQKKEDELNKIQDEEIRLIVRYRVMGWSIRKIARELHYSKSAIYKKIKSYIGGEHEHSKSND